MKRITALVGLICLLDFGPAFAKPQGFELDFDQLSISGIVKGPVDLGVATVSSATSGGALYIYPTGLFEMPEPGGFCALSAGFRPTCKADAVVAFDFPVSDLTFSSFYVTNGDTGIARAFAGNRQLPDVRVTTEQKIDLSAFPGITELFLLDESGDGDKGIAYGEFSFTATVIPLPATLPAFALGLLFLGRFRRNAPSRAQRLT